MNKLNLKLILEAIDKITTPVRRIREGFTQNLKKMRDSVGFLGFAFKYHLVTALQAVQQKLFAFGDATEKVGKKIKEAGGFFSGVLTAPIIGFGALSIRTAGQVEKLQYRLEKLTGSADKAKSVMKALEAFKVFDIEDRGRALNTLLSNSYSPDEAIERMKMLGNIAAGTENKISDMVNTYLGLRMKGKADAGDLQGMVAANIPIVAELSKQMGISEQAVYRLAEESGISFAKVKKAMQSMTNDGGRFATEMADQAKMINGSWLAMWSDMKESMAVIGQELFQKLDLGTKFRKLGETVRMLANAFVALPAPIKDIVVYGALLAAALGPILIIIGSITMGIGLMTMGFSKLIGALLILPGLLKTIATVLLTVGRVMLLTPIGQIITLISAFALAGYMVVKHWDKVKSFFLSFWESIKTAFASSIDWIMQKLQPLLSGIETVRQGWGNIKQAVTGNPVVRQSQRLFGDKPAPSSVGPVLPVGSASGAQRVDTGGTLKIIIDSQGQPRVEDARPNDRRMGYSVDTGLMMGNAY